MDAELLVTTRANTLESLAVLYNAGAAPPSRAVRRRAERQLLALRKVDPGVAMAVCVDVLRNSADPAFALAMAQTVTHLCRCCAADATWADALLELLGLSAQGGRPTPVLTALSLAVNALIARRLAWRPEDLVPALCARLDSVAATRLLAVLPEEIASDQLALSELQLDALRGEMSAPACSDALVGLCAAALAGGGTASVGTTQALRCLAAWVRDGLVSWPRLAQVLPAAMAVTSTPGAPGAAAGGETDTEHLDRLTEGCALLSAAASTFDEEAIAALLIPTSLALRPTFDQACTIAVATGDTAFIVPVAELFAHVGSSYRRLVARHAGLLELLLANASHSLAEVAVPALEFWASAGEAVLRSHAAALQPLLGALVAACTYDVDFDAWDSELQERKEEQRAAAARVVNVVALLGSRGAGGSGGGVGCEGGVGGGVEGGAEGGAPGGAAELLQRRERLRRVLWRVALATRRQWVASRCRGALWRAWTV